MIEEAKRLSELDTKEPIKPPNSAGRGGTALINYTMWTAWKQ